MVVLLHICRLFSSFDANHSHSNSKRLTTKRKLASNISEVKTQKKLTKYFTSLTNICWPLFLAVDYIWRRWKSNLVD